MLGDFAQYFISQCATAYFYRCVRGVRTYIARNFIIDRRRATAYFQLVSARKITFISW